MITIVMNGTVAFKEVKESKAGKTYVNFKISDRQSKKNQDGSYSTAFVAFQCMAFNTAAKVMDERVKDGDEVLVWGSLQAESYVSRDGEKKTTQKIIVTEVSWLGEGKNKWRTDDDSEPKKEKAAPKKEEDNDDFPF